MNSRKPRYLSKTELVRVLAALLVVIGGGGSAFVTLTDGSQTTTIPSSPPPGRRNTNRSFGMTEYVQIEVGQTTLTDARTIFGSRGNETSSDTSKTIYVWKNPDGSSATITFESGFEPGKAKVLAREQQGLE